ncbi:MAG: hypothetical protein N838_35025 [Thiohalocapsa sp. PB-PSB1]|nr:MAG: hypothetical protein N838_35025 [Thiohalocapsa sp. PB-PSB1]
MTVLTRNHSYTRQQTHTADQKKRRSYLALLFASADA